MVFDKYMAGLLTLALAALTGYQVILPDGISITEMWQFAGLVFAAIGTVFVPLLEDGWAAGLKVGVAVAGAIFAAGVPFFTDGWTTQAYVIVALAALNALAVQIGVSVRLDSAREVLADTTQSNHTIENVDPAAVYIAARVPSITTR